MPRSINSNYKWKSYGRNMNHEAVMKGACDQQAVSIPSDLHQSAWSGLLLISALENETPEAVIERILEVTPEGESLSQAIDVFIAAYARALKQNADAKLLFKKHQIV